MIRNDSQTELDFARTHARRENPPTSKASAALIYRTAEVQRGEILHAMRCAGVPLTAEEIGMRCTLDKVQVGRRMSDLGRLGQVVATDETRKTSTGRPAICWRLV